MPEGVSSVHAMLMVTQDPAGPNATISQEVELHRHPHSSRTHLSNTSKMFGASTEVLGSAPDYRPGHKPG